MYSISACNPETVLTFLKAHDHEGSAVYLLTPVSSVNNSGENAEEVYKFLDEAIIVYRAWREKQEQG